MLIPKRRRRLRVRNSGEPGGDDVREVDLHRVNLARPSRREIPAVVVGLLGFLAGAIVLQSLWGGIIGAIVALLLRSMLVRKT